MCHMHGWAMRTGLLLWCAGTLSAAHDSFGDVFPRLSSAFDDEPDKETFPDLEDMRQDMHSDSYGRMANLTLSDLVKVLQTLGYNSPTLHGDGKSVSVTAESHRRSGTKNVQILAKTVGRSITVSQCSPHDGLSSDDRTAVVTAWNWKHDRPTRAYELEEGALCLQMDAHLTKYDKANVQVIQDCMTTFIDSHCDFLHKVDGRRAQRRLSTLDDLAEHRRAGKRVLAGPLPDLPGLFERFQDDEEERLARLSPQDLERVFKALGYKQFKPSESKRHLEGELMSHHTTSDGKEMTVRATAYAWQREGELEDLEEGMELDVQDPAQLRRLDSDAKDVKVDMTLTSIDYFLLLNHKQIHKEMIKIFTEEIVRAAGNGISEENVHVAFAPGEGMDHGDLHVHCRVEVPAEVDEDAVIDHIIGSKLKIRASERVANLIGIEKVTTGYHKPGKKHGKKKMDLKGMDLEVLAKLLQKELKGSDLERLQDLLDADSVHHSSEEEAGNSSEVKDAKHGKTSIDMTLLHIDYFLLEKEPEIRDKVRRIIQEETAKVAGVDMEDVRVHFAAHRGGHSGVDTSCTIPHKLSEARLDRVGHSDLKEKISERAAAIIGIETVITGFVPPEEKSEPEVSDSINIGVCAKVKHDHSEATSSEFANTWNQEHRYSTAFYVKHDSHSANCIKSNVQLTKYNKANLQIVQMWLSTFERDIAAWHAGWMALASARRLQFV